MPEKGLVQLTMDQMLVDLPVQSEAVGPMIIIGPGHPDYEAPQEAVHGIAGLVRMGIEEMKSEPVARAHRPGKAGSWHPIDGSAGMIDQNKAGARMRRSKR